MVDFRSDRERTARYAKQTRNEVRKVNRAGNPPRVTRAPKSPFWRRPETWLIAGAVAIVSIIGALKGGVGTSTTAAPPTATTLLQSVAAQCQFLTTHLNGTYDDEARYKEADEELSLLQGTPSFTPTASKLLGAVFSDYANLVDVDNGVYPSHAVYVANRTQIEQICKNSA